MDPRVSQLIGFAHAVQATGLSYWTFHGAYRRGEVRGVTVPGGAIGLLRSDVHTFAARHRRKLAAKRAARQAKP